VTCTRSLSRPWTFSGRKEYGGLDGSVEEDQGRGHGGYTEGRKPWELVDMMSDLSEIAASMKVNLQVSIRRGRKATTASIRV